jgi:hypothetical protein
MSSIQLITDKALALGVSSHEVSWMSPLTSSSEPSCATVVDFDATLTVVPTGQSRVGQWQPIRFSVRLEWSRRSMR